LHFIRNSGLQRGRGLDRTHTIKSAGFYCCKNEFVHRWQNLLVLRHCFWQAQVDTHLGNAGMVLIHAFSLLKLFIRCAARSPGKYWRTPLFVAAGLSVALAAAAPAESADLLTNPPAQIAVQAEAKPASKPELLAPVLRLPVSSEVLPGEGNFRQWQQHAKALLNNALLLPPADPALIAAAARINPQDKTSTEQWRLQLWQPLDLYLYKPVTLRQSPVNAVILLHDHGAEFRIGKDKWLPAAQSQVPELVAQWQQKYFDGVAIAELLRAQGYLVLLADAPGFGERGPLQYAEQQQLAANLQAQGVSLAGLMAREDEAAAAFLARQPGVKGIAAVGFSMGGFRAWQLAALSADVDAAVSVGWLNSLQFLREPTNNFSRGQTAFYLIHPGLYRQLDLPDVAALGAPKPLLFLHGDKDPLMPLQQVDVAFKRIQLRYQQCGVTVPTLQVAQGQGHRFGQPLQQQMLQWLAQLQLPVAGCNS
jgi:dienelactone hydrolase